jgi:hypothetical protein
MNDGMVGVFFAIASLGCASGGAGLGPRGVVVVRGDAVRAFAVGPTVVHAFSMDRGGDVYVAPARTGTDADCVAARAVSDAQPIAVDRRNVVEIGAGQVACVASTGRAIELLWHARPAAPRSPELFLAHAKR